jgi:nucleoside-diphosphate-sugar epimerase
LLKNKKVLVTGGAGFIGLHIVDELARASLEERIRVSLEETQTRNCCQEIFDDLRLVDEKMNILADPITAIVEKETYKEPGKRNSHNT